MTPRTDAERIGNLEQEVAVLKQRAQDTAEDIRAFAPLIVEHARMRETIDQMRADLHGINTRLDRESDERRKGQSERAKERKTFVLGLLVAGVGLLGTFVATLVPLLTGGGHP